MSVLAWDGHTLATDRQITNGNTITTPICKHERYGAELLGLVGALGASRAMRDWYIAGANPDAFPKLRPDTNAVLIVVHADGSLSEYSGEPYACRYAAGLPYAAGTGESAALAAMRCGKTAAEAVQIACEVDIYCGGGVDVSALTDASAS